MMKVALVVGALVAMSACSKPPTALEVCQRLEAGGVASNCRGGTPEGLGVAAVEKAEFDLPSVPSKTGQILRFDNDEKYDKTVSAFAGLGALAGPHRYGSRATRIFVQMNNGAPAEVGTKAKAVVDALPGEDKSPPVSKAAVATVASAAPAVSASAATPKLPTAEEVCKKLEAVAVAKNCAKTDSGAKFEVLGMPAGKAGGSIVAIADETTFGKFLAGVEASPPTSPLRPFYSSQKANVVVSLPKGVPAPTESRAKGVVDGL